MIDLSGVERMTEQKKERVFRRENGREECNR